ncbi:MAG: hypothetical protein PHD03_01475 [Bacilli bacterium]|nr:hypothetical protein [Bacilli bacterium]MDD4406917.1 hypothetical protein [Bacilli bacterium]
MNYNNAISLGKILSGLSKTLGIANQVIPLYQQTKPLVKNVRSAYNLIKTNNKISNSEPKIIKNNIKPKEKTITYPDNSPQFFL